MLKAPVSPGRLPRPLRVLAFAVCVGVLLWLSLAPTDDLPGADLVWDKAQHAVAYVVLMTAGLLLFPKHPWLLVGGALGLGLAIELLQATMGFGRQGDWRDVVANGVGVLTAFLAARLLRRLGLGRR